MPYFTVPVSEEYPRSPGFGILVVGGIGAITPPPASALNSPSTAKKDIMLYTSRGCWEEWKEEK